MFEVTEELRIWSRWRRRGHYSKDCKIRNEKDSFESMKTKTSNRSFSTTHNSSRKNSFSHKQQITSHYSRKYEYHENYRATQNTLRYMPKYKLKKQDPKNRFNIHSTTGVRQEYKNIPGNSRNLRNLYRNETKIKRINIFFSLFWKAEKRIEEKKCGKNLSKKFVKKSDEFVSCW